jgi:hypothetical protein
MRFLVAIALTLAVAGCSLARKAPKSKFTGTQAVVASTIATLSSAAKNGDQAKICNQVLSSALAAKTGGRQCQTRVSDALDDADPTQLGMSVQKVTLGPGAPPTTATVVVKSGSGKNASTGTMSLVKQRGTWRVDSFG